MLLPPVERGSRLIVAAAPGIADEFDDALASARAPASRSAGGGVNLRQ